MRPRIHLFYSPRSIGIRSKVTDISAHRVPFCYRIQQRRNITADEKSLPESDQPKGPNEDQLPHISQEEAAIGEITGEGGPDVGQSSPVEEVRILTNAAQRDTSRQNQFIGSEAR